MHQCGHCLCMFAILFCYIQEYSLNLFSFSKAIELVFFMKLICMALTWMAVKTSAKK